MSELTHAVSCLVRGMPKLVTGGMPGDRAGVARLACRRLRITGLQRMALSSAVFGPGSPMPVEFTGDGSNASPPLRWSTVPPGTRSLALIVEDPDAPTPRPFVHWLLYGVDPRLRALPPQLPAEGLDLAQQGRNSMMKPGYIGAAPPKGDIAHRYCFQLFALDQELPLAGGVGRGRLLRAMRGHVIGYGELVGTYRRPA